MRWIRRRESTLQQDVAEAQKLRAEAERSLEQLERQAPYVERLTDRLIERRRENHFGDQIAVTFKPRGHHA